MVTGYSVVGGTSFQYSEEVAVKIILLKHLSCCVSTVSPQLSSQLIWSRTANTHGLPGRNIPVDLQIEHLNRVAKECIAHLGAGKTESEGHFASWKSNRYHSSCS